MGFIKRFDAQLLGYDFIEPEYLPEGKDEYYIRYQQSSKNHFRKLTGQEVDMLVRNGNMSDNWDTVLVKDPFNPGLVRNCVFFGLVRIGMLEPQCLEYHDLRLPVGLYNSMIISSDIGSNVAIHNVGYLSHFIIDEECMLFNINEMETSPKAKFGNGIIKNGETEDKRIWLEICNENGGRKVLPFNGMLTSDAYLWSKYRDDKQLMDRLQEITENAYPKERGYYGRVGHGCVIKSTKSIKDVNIGNSTYIKGANKLKNLTINSSDDSPTQIGEGVELVNGIVGYGCKIFYGVKAVRFIMGVNSSLKYGARLINSFLGENSTISCCEVLNSLIYPSHEQHHNNSFLIAASIYGQTNIAAGATIGSNHTSRANDGEIAANRGFWAGLSTTLKHNSRFASFTILAKANYLHSLDIKYPFALVANNESLNRLEVIPAYWWRYNMYAIERNTWKFVKRDKRKVVGQSFEYSHFAPDSIAEIIDAINSLKLLVGRESIGIDATEEKCIKEAERLIADGHTPDSIETRDLKFEASKRPVLIKKPVVAIKAYQDMVKYYAVQVLLAYMSEKEVTMDSILALDYRSVDKSWTNLGGQIVKVSFVEQLKADIKSGKLNSWEAIHDAYRAQDKEYLTDKVKFALYALEEIFKITISKKYLCELGEEAKGLAEYVKDQIYLSRLKDYKDDFRKMLYDNDQEMVEVVGGIDDNEFIVDSQENYKTMIEQIDRLFVKN